MAVWLTHGSGSVGVSDGVIRARDFANLIDSVELLAQARVECERLLEQARAEAQAQRDQARDEAASLVEQARAQRDAAWQTGFDQGMNEASTKWARQALDAAESTRRRLHRQSERLSSLVSLAVERVIDQEDRGGLFRRSLRTIVKLMKDVPMLTLRVHEDDRAEAQHAIGEVLEQGGSQLRIEVVADAGLPSGSCRFESDDGVVDASLDTQLAALRRAVDRAARQMMQGGGDEGDALAADDGAAKNSEDAGEDRLPLDPQDDPDPWQDAAEASEREPVPNGLEDVADDDASPDGLDGERQAA